MSAIAITNIAKLKALVEALESSSEFPLSLPFPVVITPFTDVTEFAGLQTTFIETPALIWLQVFRYWYVVQLVQALSWHELKMGCPPLQLALIHCEFEFGIAWHIASAAIAKLCATCPWQLSELVNIC